MATRKPSKKAVAAAVFIGGGVLLLWLWQRGQNAQGETIVPADGGLNLWDTWTTQSPYNSVLGDSNTQPVLRATVTYYDVDNGSAPVPGGCCND